MLKLVRNQTEQEIPPANVSYLLAQVLIAAAEPTTKDVEDAIEIAFNLAVKNNEPLEFLSYFQDKLKSGEYKIIDRNYITISESPTPDQATIVAYLWVLHNQMQKRRYPTVSVLEKILLGFAAGRFSIVAL